MKKVRIFAASKIKILIQEAGFCPNALRPGVFYTQMRTTICGVQPRGIVVMVMPKPMWNGFLATGSGRRFFSPHNINLYQNGTV